MTNPPLPASPDIRRRPRRRRPRWPRRRRDEFGRATAITSSIVETGTVQPRGPPAAAAQIGRIRLGSDPLDPLPECGDGLLADPSDRQDVTQGDLPGHRDFGARQGPGQRRHEGHGHGDPGGRTVLGSRAFGDARAHRPSGGSLRPVRGARVSAAAKADSRITSPSVPVSRSHPSPARWPPRRSASLLRPPRARWRCRRGRARRPPRGRGRRGAR